MAGDRLSRRARRVWPQDPINKAHPLNQGLLAWYLCQPETMGGNAWYDLLGQAPASLQGMSNSANGWRPTTRPGGSGELRFVNSSLAYAVASPFALNAGDYTVSCWCNLAASQSSYARIWERYTGGSALFSTLIAQSGYLQLYHSSYFIVSTISVASLAGMWHQIGITYGGTLATFYVDGSPVYSTTNPIVPPAATGIFYIGSDETLNYTYNGSMDDVRLYGYALSASQMAALYDQSSRGYPEALNWY